MPDPLKCAVDADLVVYRSLASEILFRRLHRDVAEQELDLLQFAFGCMTHACTGPAKVVWRATFDKPSFAAYSFTTCQTSFSVMPSPQAVPARQTHRNSFHS